MLDHVITMGGGIAGLCTAVSLSRAAKTVTLIEKDPLPTEIAPRQSVPQGNHLHGLLRLGAKSLEELLPGLFDELHERGSRTLDMAGDFRWFIAGQWRPRFHADLPVEMQSRPLLEAAIRERALAIPNIEFRFEQVVEQPSFDRERGRVTGVTLTDGTHLEADLVIDATGRGSKSRKWLQAWGFDPPPAQEIEIRLRYVTADLRFPGSYTPPSDALLVYPVAPTLARGSTLFHLENDRWISTSFGYHGEVPPLDPDELVEWLGTLATPDAQESLRHARFVGKTKQYNVPRQSRFLFHELSSRPEDYIVLGDAACCFDPVFGQGMAVAATQALRLGNALRDGTRSTATLQQIVGKVADTPWMMASLESQRWPQTKGFKPPAVKVLLRFMDRYYRASATDEQLHYALLKVMHLERPLQSMLSPRILMRLTSHWLSGLWTPKGSTQDAA